MATTPSDFIKARGGPNVVAAAIKESPGTVRMWALRRRIPRRVWPELIEAFPEVTLDELKRVETMGEAA